MTETQIPYEVGKRYLHFATGLPLTLKYIGSLAGTTSVWLGVEWDNPSRGKHSGEYKGEQVFHTRVPGSGSFLKYSPGSSSTAPLLLTGPSFIDVINERYSQDSITGDSRDIETVVLGSSNGNIVVEAPRLSKVRKRLNQLDNLKEAALEGLWVSSLGQGSLKGELSSLTYLNLSQNLLPNWYEAARICTLLPSLQALILNQSRLFSDINDIDVAPFAGLTTLHLGQTLTTWRELEWVCRWMPMLRVLHLNGCQYLGRLPVFEKALNQLEILNLESSVVEDWTTLASGLAILPNLQDLDLSSVQVDCIPTPSIATMVFPALIRLTLLKTPLRSWKNIDALEAWTQGRLGSLRISLDDSVPSKVGCSMKGDLSDRPILIAKLSNLSSLNSTVVTKSERTDSERFYLAFVSKVLAEDPTQTVGDWGRYQELCRVHGDPSTPLPKAKAKNVLANKMISINIVSEGVPHEVLQLLPSSPLRLAKRKIAKILGTPSTVGIACWTVQNAEEVEAGGEVVRGLEMDDDAREISWWIQDGEWTFVEFR